MSWAHRSYFALVGLFAAWVGWWGWVQPAEVARALPWTVPALHARFIASLYVAGTLAMAWSVVAASRPGDVRLPTWLAVVWTGTLLGVSLVRIDAFDFSRRQVWFWFFAYAVFPLWGAWLLARRRATRAGARRTDPVLVVVALAMLAVGAALLLAPEAMVAFWPWKVTPLLAHVYAGPFLAWGVTSLLLAREPIASARRIVLASLVVFAVLALAATWLHRPLFRADALSTWLWVGGFGLVAALAASRLVRR